MWELLSKNKRETVETDEVKLTEEVFPSWTIFRQLPYILNVLFRVSKCPARYSMWTFFVVNLSSLLWPLFSLSDSRSVSRSLVLLGNAGGRWPTDVTQLQGWRSVQSCSRQIHLIVTWSPNPCFHAFQRSLVDAVLFERSFNCLQCGN